MPRAPDPRGVCVIRVSREPHGLMLHLIARLDVTDVSGQTEATEVDPERVLDLVRQFIDDFGRGTSRT